MDMQRRLDIDDIRKYLHKETSLSVTHDNKIKLSLKGLSFV
jgi:hypothetical protein